MKKTEMIVIFDDPRVTTLSLHELCSTCSVSLDFVQALIEYDIIQPKGHAPSEWVFDMSELDRIKTAYRLRRDLEVNLAGIAILLDLLEELEALRARNAMLEKHLR